MPSVLTLAQGTVGETCLNDSSTDHSPKQPRYGPNLYFGLLSILIATSGIAFYLLNNLNVSLNERYDRLSSDSLSTVPESEQKDLNPSHENDESKPLQGSGQMDLTNVRVYDVFCGSGREEFASIRWTLVQLYSIHAIVSALGHGVVPGILSYACLPYGPTTYHLATALGLIANPVCCFLALFVACQRPSALGILCSVSVVIAAVIIYTATLSPTPWLVGTTEGSVLIVILNVLWTGCISYIKVNVASALQKFGENSLLFCGIFNQLGSCLGSIIIFLINFKTNTFKAC
jgi:riboflavin transporter 2